MADYRIVLSRSAIKEFENLPANVIERIRAKSVPSAAILDRME